MDLFRGFGTLLVVLPLVVSDARQRLQALLGLSADQASRAVAETLDCFQLGVDAYIAARHAELQSEGDANPEIFERIATEVQSMLFRAPALTARQIRRRIYG